MKKCCFLADVELHILFPLETKALFSVVWVSPGDNKILSIRSRAHAALKHSYSLFISPPASSQTVHHLNHLFDTVVKKCLIDWYRGGILFRSPHVYTSRGSKAGATFMCKLYLRSHLCFIFWFADYRRRWISAKKRELSVYQLG